MSSKSSITPKQARFVSEYLIDLNATQAAIRAGYSKKTANEQGSQLLAKLSIQEAIAEGTKKKTKKAEISAEYVLSSLKEVVERCLQREPVMRFDYATKEMVQVQDEEGRDVWTFNAIGANKALELLGKHLKLFTEKHEHLVVKTLEELIAASNEEDDDRSGKKSGN